MKFQITPEIMETTFGKLTENECVAVGFPFRCDYNRNYFICKSYEECVNLFEQHDFVDCFVTNMHMNSNRYTQEERTTKGCTLNTIIFDLDNEDKQLVHEEAVRLIKWIQRHNGHPMVKLTTNKGMHISIPVQPTVFKNPRRVLKWFVEMVVEHGGFRTIDAQVTYDVNRIIRVPYTIHSKTMYTTCFIPVIDVLTLSTDDVFDRFRHLDHQYVPKRIEGFNDLMEHMSDMDITEPEFDYSKMPAEFEYRPCTYHECRCVTDRLLHGVKVGERDNNLNGIYFFSKQHGLSEENIFKVLKYIQLHSPDISNDMIDMIMRRNRNRNYGYCTFLQDNNICGDCPKCTAHTQKKEKEKDLLSVI